MAKQEANASTPGGGTEQGLEKEKAGGTHVVASLKEIGGIVVKRGIYSEYQGYTGILASRDKTVSIPFSEGTELEATVSFPANELSRSLPQIYIRVTGLSPQHYKEPTAARRSLTLIGKNPWDRDDIIAIKVNKFFFPDAKDFEKPQPAETESERLCEEWSPVIEYKNKDGEDFVEVKGPSGRLGEKTLAFAEEFANEALEYLIRYDETEPVVQDQAPMLPEPFQL